MKKITKYNIGWKNCDFWALNDEYGYNNNMFYYFRKVAQKQGANINYCYIVELSHNGEWPKMIPDCDIYYNDKPNGIKIHWLYMARYNGFILVYEP